MRKQFDGTFSMHKVDADIYHIILHSKKLCNCISVSQRNESDLRYKCNLPR